jgi:hypothetical protein
MNIDLSQLITVDDKAAQAKDIDKRLLITSSQMYMDSTAAASGYYDIKTAVTYAEEPSVPKFQLEGQAFRAWRSLVWDYCFTQIALIEAGTRTQPTADEWIAELPTLELS